MVDTKQIPHSIDAERSILCAALRDPARIDDLAEIVQADDWYDPAHREIWDATVKAHEEKAVDTVRVAELLNDAGRLDAVGGPEYLGDLHDYAGTTVNASRHAATVHDYGRRRRMLAVLEELHAEGHGNTDADSFAERVLAQVMAHGSERARGGARSLVEMLPTILQRIEGTDDSGERIPTPWSDLNAILRGGLRGGRQYIIAARPAMGKSAFVKDLAIHAAKIGKHALLFSVEMDGEDVGMRVVSSESGVPLGRLDAGTGLRAEEYGHVNGKMLPAAKWGARFLVDDEPGMTIEKIAARARRLHAQGKCDLIAVDYLQLLRSANGREPREVQVSAMSRGLRELARSLNVPMLALAQLNRELEKRGDKRPMLADLRESGSIEQDADAVMMLYRGAVYADEGSRDRSDPTTEVLIRKQRQGALGTVLLNFDGTRTRFTSSMEARS